MNWTTEAENDTNSVATTALYHVLVTTGIMSECNSLFDGLTG